MIKRYYLIIKKYFNLHANNKRLLFHLFISSLLRSLTFLTIPYFASLIIKYATSGDFRLAVVSSFFFLSASCFHVLCYHYNMYSYSKDATVTHNKLQELILESVTSYDENFTKHIPIANIINTAFNDVGNVQQIANETFDLITELIGMLVAIIILTKVNIYIGITTIILLLITISTLGINMKKRDYYLNIQRKEQDNIASIMGQTIDGSKEIKTFNMVEGLASHLEKHKRIHKNTYFKKKIYDNNIEVIIPIILGTGKIFIYGILIYLILNGQYEVSTLVLVIGYYENIESKYESFYTKLDELSSNSIRVDRIHNILNYKNKNMLTFGDNSNDFIKGCIEFKNVTFTYEKKKIMSNISFKIKPNTFTAIVGKSGSGKSTIFRLLLRLYKPDSGSILLDNESIYNYTKEVYSSNVSIVTQKPFIFDMSIRENLNLVETDHNKQIEACKKAGIHDFIMSLKNGYNTKLVRDAENISSGQKQLIALARTLLSQSEVLLFDEVTSSLDANTSKQVASIFSELKKDHTILMITHKPELMKLADEIIVINHGKIVGRGEHKKLIENNKYYKVLHKN